MTDVGAIVGCATAPTAPNPEPNPNPKPKPKPTTTVAAPTWLILSNI
jgi:hypothetical protein